MLFCSQIPFFAVENGVYFTLPTVETKYICNKWTYNDRSADDANGSLQRQQFVVHNQSIHPSS